MLGVIVDCRLTPWIVLVNFVTTNKPGSDPRLSAVTSIAVISQLLKIYSEWLYFSAKT